MDDGQDGGRGKTAAEGGGGFEGEGDSLDRADGIGKAKEEKVKAPRQGG
jgi:hypothetical protein